MGDPKRHHYVPRFLLAGWCGTDGKLACYARKGGRLVIDRHTPEHTAFETNLYAIEALPEADRQFVEREVMSRVDEPASAVLKRLLAGELHKLGSDERTNCARFMLAQWLRSPEEIAKLRQQGREIILKELERNPEEYLAVKGSAPEETLQEWTEARIKGLDEIATMTQMLPMGINNEGPGSIIINMRWEVIDLAASTVDLLTSDRPVMRFQGLKSRDCMIMIPLGPRRLFVATHYDRGLQRQRPKLVARAANMSTVRAAHARVYGTSSQHRALLEKYLKRPNAAR
jgi:Protein of unknown function (DUF4238)